VHDHVGDVLGEIVARRLVIELRDVGERGRLLDRRDVLRVAVAVNVIFGVLREEGVVPRRVVQDLVEQDAHAERVRRAHERRQILWRAERRVDAVIIVHAIGASERRVHARGLADRRHRHEVHDVEAEIVDAPEIGGHGGEGSGLRIDFRVHGIDRGRAQIDRSAARICACSVGCRVLTTRARVARRPVQRARVLASDGGVRSRPNVVIVASTVESRFPVRA
jgi:hypothetical protein